MRLFAGSERGIRSYLMPALLSLLLALATGCGSSGGDDPQPEDTGGGGGDVGGFDVVRPPVDIVEPEDVPVTPDVPENVDAVEDTDGPAPDVQTTGEFGDPCATNEECRSGWCIDTALGAVCTRTCQSVQACGDGWLCRSVPQLLPDVIFLCIPNAVEYCKPCLVDRQCAEGYCVEMEPGAKFCTTPCDMSEGCPGEGFVCENVANGGDDGEARDVCMPTSGTCSCREDSLDQIRSCARENEFGRCAGFETCTAEGWSGCDAPEPSEEVCDGLDNDCNGIADDGLPETRPCENVVDEIGTCQGEERCFGSSGWICDAPTPEAERCDYRDNDCDGAVDEDFQVEGVYGLEEHCGVCNKSCEGSIPNATSVSCDGALEPPQCVVDQCQDGFVQLSEFLCGLRANTVCRPCMDDDGCGEGFCIPVAGANFCSKRCSSDMDCESPYVCRTIAHPSGTGDLGDFCVYSNTTCDCPPDVDPDDTLSRTCEIVNGVGTCRGFETCDPEQGWVGCDAMPATEEVCDGEDNDCNGFVDDGLPASRSCQNSNEFGTCTGEESCYGTAGWICQAPVPEMEICDFRDNDCDGVVDDPFKTNGQYLGYDHCGSCNAACGGTIPNATTQCELVAGAPQCTVATCNPGYVKVGYFQCVLPTDTHCQPCSDDAQCLGGLCVEYGGDSVCLARCDGDTCAGGRTCETIAGEGDVCVPASGTCTCTEQTAGQRRPCEFTNEFGTCGGIETCDPSSGWTACNAPVPGAEVCNGLDDDCDGVFDNEPTDDPGECEISNLYGTCSGTAVCSGAQGWTCNGMTPGPEDCDYQDNNCNGEIDEMFKVDGVYGIFDHCGGCNQSCLNHFPNATATCDPERDPPVCIVAECDEGFIKVNDFLCAAETSTLCEACTQDANCSYPGAKCLRQDDGTFCSRPCESVEDCPDGYICTAYAGGGADLQCQPATGSCTCGPDNHGFTRPCSVTWSDPADPEGPSYTCVGAEECTGFGWSDCQLPTETCDGMDNDCDGAIDEGFLNSVTGRYESDEHCGACDISCANLCSGPGMACEGICDASNADVLPFCRIECNYNHVDVNGYAGDGCECNIIPGDDRPNGFDYNCDGVDGDISKALFVANSGDDANDGTIDAPLFNIQTALDRAWARADKTDVYVSTGVYERSLELRPGVHLFGGYSPDFLERDPLQFSTVIMGDAPVPDSPGAIVARSITGDAATTLDGFKIFAADAAGAGESSYAIFLVNCDSALTIRNNTIVGADGGAGLAGSDGVRGSDGVDGGAGAAAYDFGGTNCPAASLQSGGGAGGAAACSDFSVSGGVGGGAFCPLYDRSEPYVGQDGGGGTGFEAGPGGAAGFDRYYDSTADCTICRDPLDARPSAGTDGADGALGTDGWAGAGCLDTLGSLSIQGLYVPAYGADGIGGGAGSGGGGGGAGGSVEAVAAVCAGVQTDAIGGSGGGGGAGACGGTGGLGAQSGGGSFGIFLWHTFPPAGTPNIIANEILRGAGGSGGSGGAGGAGGVGGDGGAGGAAGTGDFACASAGGDGGDGGAGGHGAGGGGGCGGPSYAIYIRGTLALDTDYLGAANSFRGGALGGVGGAGGASPGEAGGEGTEGPYGDVFMAE